MLRPGLKIFFVLGLLLRPATLSAQADSAHAAIDAALEAAYEAVESGDLRAAEGHAERAFLAFEGIEPSLEALDHQGSEALESRLEAARTALSAEQLAEAEGAIEEARALLGGIGGAAPETTPPWAAFLQSFGILFREGIEALLLCTALAAAAVKAGRGHGSAPIWRGAALAIAASLATAVLVERVLHLAPAGREAIEGVTMLLAALVLFYVSYWLLSKLEVARWLSYLADQVRSSRSRWALASVAFLAVYREGVETVLFYQALSAIAEPLPIWAGAAAGAVALALVGVAILRFGLRLPIRPLFAITGGLLYLLAFVFLGQGIHELQEAAWISLTGVAGAPRIGWLGVYPTVETLTAQAVLVALALVAALVLWRRRDPGGPPSEPPAARPRERAAAR